MTTSASHPRPPSATAMNVFLSRSQSALPPKMLLATEATFSATPGPSPGVVVFVTPAPCDEVSEVVPGSCTEGAFVDVDPGTATEEVVVEVDGPTVLVPVTGVDVVEDVDVDPGLVNVDEVVVDVGGVKVVVVDVGGVVKVVVDVSVVLADVLVAVSVVVVEELVEVSVVVVEVDVDVVEVSVVVVDVVVVDVLVEVSVVLVDGLVDVDGSVKVDVGVSVVVELVEVSVARTIPAFAGATADAVMAGDKAPAAIPPMTSSGRAAPVNRERVRRAISFPHAISGGCRLDRRW
jgi:hypothetical protein